MGLISAALGRAALKIFTRTDLTILTTEFTFGEVEVHLPKLAEQYDLEPALVESNLAYVGSRVRIIPRIEYDSGMAEAQRRVGQIDPEDVDLLALSIVKGVPVWSNDHHFEAAGVAAIPTAMLLRLFGL